MAAYVSVHLARKGKAKDKAEREDLDEIAKIAMARREEVKSRAVEALAEKLPPGLSAEELRKVIGSQIRIGGDLVIEQASPEEKELVEDLVNSYHQQALSQAKVQFWFSVAAATVGFGYIIYSANQVEMTSVVSYMKILPGVVIDVVAALFFRQAEQTRERATDLYDRLRQDRQAARAEAMVASIEDTTIRSAVKAQIALHMAGLEPKEIDLPTFFSSHCPKSEESQPRGALDGHSAGAP